MRIELDTLLENDIIQPNKIAELICEGVSIFKGYSDNIAYFADKYTFVKFNKDLCEGFNKPTYRIEVKEKNPVAEGFVSKFGIKNKHDLEEAIKWLSYYPKDDQPKLLEEIKILSELFFDKGASAKIAKTNITDKEKDVDSADNEEDSLEEEIISENKQQVMSSITKTNERHWKDGHKEETTTPNGTKLKVSIPEVPTSDYEDTNSKFHKLVQGRVNGIEHRQGYDFTPEEREKAYDRFVAEEKHKLEKDAFKKAKAESEELKGFRNKANQQKHKLERETQAESYELNESRDAKKVEKAMFTPDRTELEDGDAAGREKLKDNGYELSDILESLRVELLETPMVSHADNNESKEDFINYPGDRTIIYGKDKETEKAMKKQKN